MEPDDLIKKLQGRVEAESDLEMNRIDAIGHVYSMATQAFLQNPQAFDDGFTLSRLKNYSEKERREWFKKCFEALLDASIEAIVTGENFIMDTKSKVGAKRIASSEVKIDGVETPSLNSGHNYFSRCNCGHTFGQHTDGELGPCSGFNCDCAKFEEGGKG